MLCKTSQRRVDPRRLLAGWHEQDEQECPEGRHQESEEDGEERRSPQRRDARRRELVGRARERFTTANEGSACANPSTYTSAASRTTSGQADVRRRRHGESRDRRQHRRARA